MKQSGKPGRCKPKCWSPESERKKVEAAKCVACNGSGRYDHNGMGGSPDCGACNGTGKKSDN